MKFDELPNDILVLIFKRCGVGSWPSLSQVCRRFHSILGPNSFLWFQVIKDLLIVNSKAESIKNRSFFVPTARDRLWMFKNWRKGLCIVQKVISSNERHLQPWLHLESHNLWIGMGKNIKSINRTPPSRFQAAGNRPNYSKVSAVCVSNLGDVGRFAVGNGAVAAGSTYGSLHVWSKTSGRLQLLRKNCHYSDVTTVCMCRNLLISGSRDRTVNIWERSFGNLNQLHSINIEDRVISLAVDPGGSFFCMGSSGHENIPPAQLYDLHTGQLVSNLRSSFRQGEGIYDIHFESANQLLTAGFDSALRLWDSRILRNVMTWDDPHDSSINCMASDDYVTIITGTNTNGAVRLWDKRHSRCVQLFYVQPEMRSPVYSVAFDSTQLFVALDAAVFGFDFTAKAVTREQSAAVLSVY